MLSCLYNATILSSKSIISIANNVKKVVLNFTVCLLNVVGNDNDPELNRNNKIII